MIMVMVTTMLLRPLRLGELRESRPFRIELRITHCSPRIPTRGDILRRTQSDSSGAGEKCMRCLQRTSDSREALWTRTGLG